MDTDFGHLGTSASAAVQVESSTHAHPWMPYLHSTHTHSWQIKRFSNILNNGAWNTKIKSSGSAGTGPSAALEAHESTTHMNFLLLLLLLFFFISLFFFGRLCDGNKCAGKPVGPYHVLLVLLPLGVELEREGGREGGGRGASTSTGAYIKRWAAWRN